MHQKKAAAVDLGLFFPDYTGGLNIKKAKDFVSDQYLVQNKCDRKV